MSSPAEYYKSLPPISKGFGTLCLVCTTAFQLGLLDLYYIALVHRLAFSRFQVNSNEKEHETKIVVAAGKRTEYTLAQDLVWRLVTNFFFLGKFSINFGIRLIMIARYGVQLETGPFQRRTADFLWMMIFGALTILILSVIPMCYSPFLGTSLVFMLLYVWSREFPNGQINMYGLVTLKAFYLPWAMLVLDVLFGAPVIPDFLGIVAGHLYYFLTVLHPLATGKTYLKTPRWVHKIVARWRIGAPAPTTTTARSGAAPPEATTGAFRGRARRLSD